jgi:hypothetical protein
MMKTNACAKSTELTAVLNAHFNGKIHLAIVKLMSMLILSLCKVQTVSFEKLANAFDCKVNSSSSLRRIKRFFTHFSLDSYYVARLIFGLLPNQGKLILSMDRTNGKFAMTDINILMLGIVYHAVAFPLLLSMLKKGVSQTAKCEAILLTGLSVFLEKRPANRLCRSGICGGKMLGFSQQPEFDVKIGLAVFFNKNENPAASSSAVACYRCTI